MDNNQNNLNMDDGANIAPEAPVVNTENVSVSEAPTDNVENVGAPEVSADNGGTLPPNDGPLLPNGDSSVVIGNASAPKKKSKKAAIIILTLLLLIAGGVTAVILLWPAITGGNKGQSNSQQNNDNPTETISEFRLKDNSLSDFDLELLKQNGKEENRVYSPLSIKYVLQMLSDASDGNTKKQIDAVLGDYKAKAYLNGKNRSLANALFVRNDYKSNILDSYIDGLKSGYGAEVVFDDFANANNINKWVSEKTLNIIKNALNDADVESVDYALVNALAIDMQWTDRIQRACVNDSRNRYYDVSYSHEKYNAHVGPLCNYGGEKITFNNQKDVEAGEIGASINNYDIIKEIGEDKIRSTVKAEYEKWLKTDDGKSHGNKDVDSYMDEYMEDLGANYGKYDYSTTFSMYDGDDVKAFSKDLQQYDGTTLQYVGIMPKTKTVDEYVESAKAEGIANVISSLKTIAPNNFKEGVVTKIYGYIPFFNYEYSQDLTENLKQLGMTDVFDPSTADLSKMTKAEGASMTFVKHKANIDFSNEGIKAAAVTVAGGEGNSRGGFIYDWDVPVEEIDLTFDKPFIYIIRDRESGEIWFAGSVYKIEK